MIRCKTLKFTGGETHKIPVEFFFFEIITKIKNHYKLRYFLSQIIIVILLLISHLFFMSG
jgi:hypothetical protein